MGWTSIHASQKPDVKELNRIADRDLDGPNLRIVERSGWRGWNHHRYTLMETITPEPPHTQPVLFIAVTIVEYRDNQIFWRTMEDASGPLVYDCPVKFVHQANQSSPGNERQAAWRAEVLTQTQEQAQVKKLLGDLRKTHPNCDSRIVMGKDTQATYKPARHRGQRIHTYHVPGDTSFYRLNPVNLNLEATLLLRKTPYVESPP